MSDEFLDMNRAGKSWVDRVNSEPGWVLLSNGTIIDTKTLGANEIIDVEGVGKVTAEYCWDKGGKANNNRYILVGGFIIDTSKKGWEKHAAKARNKEVNDE